MRIIVFFLLISILSCKSDNKQNKNSDISVHQVFDLIDQVYSIDKNDRYFRVKRISKSYLKDNCKVTSFNKEGVFAFYRYGNFEILEYESERFSSKAFQKVFNDVKNKSGFCKDEFERFNILSKSGIVYILKGNYIISKLRRCNDDWLKNEKLEESLLKKLFDSKPPKEKYFIRICCSCPVSEMEDLR